jgi:hypothetical protein
MKQRNYIVDPIDEYMESLPAWVQYCLGLVVFMVCWAFLFALLGIA